jgi:hypothetical protein
MKAANLSVVFLSFGLSCGVITGARALLGPGGQVVEGRPELYALRIVSENDVDDAKDALGAPDKRYARFPPGGQLVLLMQKDFIDSGRVVCTGEPDYGLEGWVRVQDTKDERQNYAWIIIQRESCDRFVFFPEAYLPFGGTGINTIRITNVGENPLLVDALIGYGAVAERK